MYTMIEGDPILILYLQWYTYMVVAIWGFEDLSTYLSIMLPNYKNIVKSWLGIIIKVLILIWDFD